MADLQELERLRRLIKLRDQELRKLKDDNFALARAVRDLELERNQLAQELEKRLSPVEKELREKQAEWDARHGKQRKRA